jgi:hypothetical protein
MWLHLWLLVRNGVIQILVRKLNKTEGFHGFPQPLQINVRIVFQTKPQPVPHVFKFIIHNPSLHLMP